MPIVFAIIPVFLIILCGYLCRHYQFPDEGFWRGAERITYFLLFPALLVSKMVTANLDGIDFIKPIIVVVLLFLIATMLFVLSKPLFGFKNREFTSIYQGGIRFNTYIGLAIVFSLYGSEGLVIAVVIASIMIPVINVFCVVMLEYYAGHEGKRQSKSRVFTSVITNPLILACVIGMGINLLGFSLPQVIVETLNIFARAALPLGLLTVGAALTLTTIKSSVLPLIFSTAFKFVLLPAIAMALCFLWGVDPMVRNIILVLTTLPTATASYVLARQLDGDHELMATIISLQTLLAVIFIPLIFLIVLPLI
jgi:predicted permease